MSKKIAADHIKLKRAYELPAPDERTGLCFRESEVKAYGDALKSCGWPPHFVRVRQFRAMLCVRGLASNRFIGPSVLKPLYGRCAPGRSSPVAEPIDYMLRRWDRFAKFLDDGRIRHPRNRGRVTFEDGGSLVRSRWR